LRAIPTRLTWLLVLVAALAVTILAPTATAAPPYLTSPMFQDCATGEGPGPCADMSGPSGFGSVSFTTYGPDLKLQVKLRNATPNTSYTIFLTCGPTHALVCGFVEIGTLMTNEFGRATDNQIIVPMPFGGGTRTDHVDIVGADGSVYVAGSIDYTTSS
jgi:hypothetical protein